MKWKIWGILQTKGGGSNLLR